MSNNGQRRSEARIKADAMRRGQARKEHRAKIFTFTFTGFALLAVVAGVTWAVNAQSNAAEIEGVRTYDNLARDHITEPVPITPLPPTGGKHSATLQNCGVYLTPVANENAIHSLEHGAVWITYQTNLPAADRDTLAKHAQGQTHILISPYPTQSAPVVATAWGTQLELTGPTDPRLATFVTKYQNGKQTPEPGAPCTGGTGTPQPPGPQS